MQEDATVQHFAAKAIENITSTNGIHCQRFSTNENGHLLWHLFTHSTADSLRVSAISALCRLTKQSPAIFQGVIEKAGLPAVLDGLAVNIPRVQQAIVTMFAWILTEGAHVQRLVQEKDFTLRIMKLAESPSLVIRAKAFLTILKIITKNSEMIPLCCQSRLVMFIERDWRKQQSSEVTSDQGQVDYLLSCLELLMTHLVDSMPEILGAAVTSLNAVSGRKHPSSLQAKALKTSLPLTTLPHYMMTSQIFRSKITSERFLIDIGDLLFHVNALDANETNIDSAIGSSGVQDFIHSVLGILEVVSHHPILLMEHHSVVVENILPPLASLVSSDNGDTRLFCLGLFADIVALYLNHDHLTEDQSLLNEKFLSETITVKLLPQMEQILLDTDPLPLFGSKLLLALVEQSPSLISNIQESELIPVLFQALIDHQSTPTSSVVRHLVNIFCCLVASREMDMRRLYDQGLVDHLMNLFQDVSPLCKTDSESREMKSAVVVMKALTELLHSLLKYVAGVVRSILQATKSGQSTDTDIAETLLLSNKSLIELTDILIQTLCASDTDLSILACGCLSLLAQLFGGEYNNALSAENANGLARALLQLDPKQQKILLKFVKRIISADPSQAERLRDEAGILADALQRLISTASSNADVGITTMSADILKSAGVR
ncbi:putative serine/threonine-protein kinase ULK4-like [Apostichopus japonicus]|uniref:Putative serine/threonine-protein kinase ULK4-like n=1 Tax=Stichopus japonicus TaxID=307972 RepID=A0A2G8JN96_STIJA|nr:putative serine/threonine-protein kinase ULK4-like [Apostichopus japonicus]